MSTRYAIPELSRYTLILEDDGTWTVLGLKGEPLTGTCRAHDQDRRLYCMTKDNGRVAVLQLARLILFALTGLPPHYARWACHRDGNPSNNHPDNLYWGTPRDNSLDTIWHQTAPRTRRPHPQ